MRIAIVIILLVFACSQKSSTGTESQFDVDFRQHLELLKHLNKVDSFDTKGTASIVFLEEHTGIESEADIDLLGKIYFTENDLQKWESWYDQNKGNLLKASKKKQND